MKPQSKKTEESLRHKAENRLLGNPVPTEFIVDFNYSKVLHELRVHQIELEMQNDELRQAQKRLEESQAKYFDLYDLAPVGYLTLGEQLQVLEVNLTAANLLGMPMGRILKRRFSQFIDPESQDTFYFHVRMLMESGRQQSCELKIQKKDSKSFFIHLESRPVLNAQNRITRIWASLIDIHEKKQAADALKQSATQNELLLNLLPHSAMLIDKERKILAANRLARESGAEIGGYWPSDKGQTDQPEKETVVFEHPWKMGPDGAQGVFCLACADPSQQGLVTVVEESNEAVAVYDVDGNIKSWNRKAEKLYGYSAAEALRMTMFDLVPTRLEKETLNLLSDVKSGVPVKSFETRRLAKDGCILDIWLTITRLIQDDKIVGLATTEKDISEYNRWLASIKKLPQRIILAQEEERNRISQEIHSDFGASLTALKMLISTSAAQVGEQNPQLKSVFEKVKDRLSRIIHKARDLSHKLAPPGLKCFGLLGALKKLVESASYNKKKLNIQFFQRGMMNISFGSKDIIIYRIVQESLQNMLKHAKATEAHIKAIFRKSVFSLEIRDNGRGFDQAKISPSKGLGLDLIKQQVVLLHGSLSMESWPGKGTTIKIVVPIKEKKTHG
ncbi:MAG: PAS domain S-box protein [Patescibacteria group bacterium]